jgi:hypothetical protein
MVDLVVVKFNGSKNQSIRGKSWAPLLTFQWCLFSIPDLWGKRWVLGSTLVTPTESMEIWVRTKTYISCSGYNAPALCDLVVVKFNGSKNQSIRGKSWAPLLTFQWCLFSIPDFSRNRIAGTLVFCVVFCIPFPFFKFFSPTYLSNNEHWQYTLELMDRTVTKYVKFDGKLCNTGKKSSWDILFSML